MSAASTQLALLALLFACGWVVAFVFHLTAVALASVKAWLRHLVEATVGLAAVVFVLWCNLSFADGQFRLPLVASIFAGFVAYYTICKEILDKTIIALYNFFTKKR